MVGAGAVAAIYGLANANGGALMAGFIFAAMGGFVYYGSKRD